MKNNLLDEKHIGISVSETDERIVLPIGDGNEPFTVYKIKIDELYYNDQNDRIATYMSQYKQENHVNEINMDNLEEYNAIMHKFIVDSNPKEIERTKTSIKLNGQKKVAVVLADGRVIDGNRRFTCLRNLQEETGEPKYIKAAILKHDFDQNKKDIKRLELSLQFGEEKPVDYDKIDRLVGIYKTLVEDKMFTEDEYVKCMNGNVSKAEIKKEIAKAKIMNDFLEFINAKGKYHIAKKMNLNDALEELYKTLKSIRDEDRKMSIKDIAFANILMQAQGDSARKEIRSINAIVNSKYEAEYIDSCEEELERVFELIDSCEEVNEQTINDKIRTNDNLRKDMQRLNEKYKSRSDGEKNRNEQLKAVRNAFNSLDNIDVNIVDRLNEEEKTKILEQLNLIDDIVEKLRGHLDV